MRSLFVSARARVLLICLNHTVCKLASIVQTALVQLAAMDPLEAALTAPTWMRAARARIEAQRAGLTTEATPARAVLESALHAPVQEFNLPAGKGGGALSAPQPRRTMREAGLLMHRKSGGAVLATGFHPARHTVMVCGRPVQVEL